MYFYTFFNWSCNPGARVIAANIIVTTIIIVYIRRVEVELEHDGQAEQHSEQAALPQQHASCKQTISKFNVCTY